MLIQFVFSLAQKILYFDQAEIKYIFPCLESYVADEIITSRAGVRVRVGNTDAEGRMVMADVLCQMKEKVRPTVLITCSK